MKLSLFLLLLILQQSAASQNVFLSPPYFNLAEGKNISSSATCGEDNGRPINETYCKTTGANPFTDQEGGPQDVLLWQAGSFIRGGQLCDYCKSDVPEKSHPIHQAIDGTGRWWQSPPLSRGDEYNRVNITIDLGQEYHVAYIYMRMATSPRPAVWALERSVDGGKSWHPWQYFAESDRQCREFFNTPAEITPHFDEQVLCVTRFSNLIPLEEGEIVVSLVNDRPSSHEFAFSDRLQEFTKATNIRIRLLRAKTLYGQLMSQSHDVSILRRYYYSIKDISIGGRCVCNGHASVCNETVPGEPSKLRCSCQHNTCGHQCDTCCPGFRNRKWRPATTRSENSCEACQCNGHSNECEFNETLNSAICFNCIHYTTGPTCDKCIEGYFHPKGVALDDLNACVRCNCPLYDEDTGVQLSSDRCSDQDGTCECLPAFTGEDCTQCSPDHMGDWPNCVPCYCYIKGSVGAQCDAADGRCTCREHYSGGKCNFCSEGYYNSTSTIGASTTEECIKCDCEEIGTEADSFCDRQTGQCKCKAGYGGLRCDRCDIGYYSYPECTRCNCERYGVNATVCSQVTGECFCKERFSGPACEACQPGFYNRGICDPCQCSGAGVSPQYPNICMENGQCYCKQGFSGLACESCMPGYYGYPDCQACNCSADGTLSNSADDCDVKTGQCRCRPTTTGRLCDKCTPNLYNFPECEVCNCDPTGAIQVAGLPPGGCGALNPNDRAMLCKCKPNVEGRICSRCRSGYWNLNGANPDGCENCACELAGTIGELSVCQNSTGQCPCRRWATTRDCSQCSDGFFRLESRNIFGCSPCNCDRGGSDLSTPCDKESGQCNCLTGIQGLRCNEPDSTHYFPNLHQHRFEMEDGYQVEGEQKHDARYLDDESLFSAYSWKGYVVMSGMQSEVYVDLPIEVTARSNTTHYVIFSYVNPTDQDITGTIRFRPTADSSISGDTSSEQHLPITFKSSAASTRQMFTEIRGPFELVSPSSSGGAPIPMTLGLDLKADLRRLPQATLFVDYVVLLPSEYREGVVLRQRVHDACTLDTKYDTTFCRWYTFPNVPPGTVESSMPNECTKIPSTLGAAKPIFLEPFVGNLLPQDLPHATLGSSLNYMLRPPAATGRYVILVDFASISAFDESMPQSELDISVGSGRLGKTFGFVRLQHCRMYCRQVVKDENGNQPAVFTLSPLPTSDGCVPISLDLRQGGPRAVAIKSISLVPADQWHISLLRAEPACLVVNGKCSAEVHMDPPAGSVVSHFANAPTASAYVETLENIPTKPKTVTLGPSIAIGGGVSSSSIAFYISANITSEGKYALFVHYFQPQASDLRINGITLNSDRGSSFRQIGYLELPFCPSNAGCFAEISFPMSQEPGIPLPAGVISIDFLASTSIGPSHLNRLLVIPVRKTESGSIIRPSFDVHLLDLSNHFYSQCISKGFYIDEVKESNTLCRQLLFTLTTAYNDGGLSCDCESSGLDENIVSRMGRQCASMGGQCYCKPNVIGRQCSACRPGYYGFPNCKPCRCTRGTCDADTGECICPPNVEGDQCDRCVAGAWGYNRIKGCQRCNCDPKGVRDGRVDACDSLNGNCTCRDNVESRRCDRCRAGFYSFPDCTECDCDRRGTLENVCDGDSGQCRCKPNIDPTSPSCDACKPNHYHLDAGNPQGCTKCYCSNQARVCQSSQNLCWQPIVDMIGWRMSPPASIELSRNGDNSLRTFFYPASVADVDFLMRPETLDSSSFYFVAPTTYLGNQVKSYGGSLKWNLSISPNVGISNNNGAVVPDVVLIGGRAQPPMAVGFTFSDNPFNTGDIAQLSVPLTERSFRRLNGQSISREDFMEILINLKAILIRASYHPSPQSAIIRDVSLEVASEVENIDDKQKALSVEICSCPSGYSGTSCERCAEGYTRKLLVAGGFECVPCECGGRSQKCDPETGECMECSGNFAGSRCERCLIGHYYDSRYDSCELCKCPGGSIETSYANNCTVDSRGRLVICECRPGFSGKLCEVCAPGHFGDPVSGKPCEPCICNSNINMSDPNACDRQTGVCLTCLYDTSGSSCSQCRDWFYGSALERRCVACDCDKCGAKKCDGITGLCECRQNVTGRRCDQCLPNYYGFPSCEGCKACECGAASKSATCDLVTGQCSCVSSSVTGRRCDECADGYWQYTAEGCTPCECGRNGSFTCDKATGRCLCKEGYTGPRCESCAPGWLPIEGMGCQACDECVRQLAGDVFEEEKKAADSYASLQQLSASVEARNRLADLKARLANVTNTLTTSTPSDIAAHANDQMKDLTKSLETIKTMLADFQRRMIEAKANGEKFNVTSKSVAAKFENLTSLINGLEQELLELTQLVRRYIESLRDPVQFNWREMLDAAQAKILAMEQAVNVSKQEVDAWLAELDATMTLYNSVSLLHQNFTLIQERLDAIQLKLNTTLPQKLNELNDGVSQILKTAEDLRRNLSSGENELRDVKEKITRISELEQNAVRYSNDYVRDVAALNSSLEQCEANHGPTRFEKMSSECSKLEQQMAEYVATWQIEIQKYNETIVPRQTKRVQELEDRVRAIEQKIFNPSESQRQAIDVATRYDKIAEKLSSAYATIDSTVALVQELSDNVSRVDQVTDYRKRSSQIASKTERLQKEKDALDMDSKSIDTKLMQEDKRRVETESKIDQTGTILGMVKEKDLVIGLDDLSKRSDAAKNSLESISAEAKMKDMEATQLIASLQGKDPEAERHFRQASIDTDRAKATHVQIEDNWKNLKKVEQELRSLNSELGELTDSLWALIGRSKEATAQLSDIRPAMFLNSSMASAEIALDHETVAALGVDLAVDLQHLPCESLTTDNGRSLVFYLGPNFATLAGNATNEADFLALELSRPESGRFKYWATLNLGMNSRLEGSVEFNHKLPSSCNTPGLMHRLSIRRSAQQLNLTVGYRHSGRGKEDTALGTFTTLLPDSNFFFRPKMARMFVGGLPKDFSGPPGIAQSASIGLYQHLDLHSTKPTALFNLANYSGLKLANGMSRTDDYNMALLSGDLSYVSLPLAANKINKTEFQVISFAIEFATLQANALLAYMASDDKKDFVALDLRDGVLRLQFDMYKHVLEIKEDCGGKRFNDGVLHRVLVEVSNKMSSLYAVDCPEIQRAEYPQPTDSSPNILNVDTLYLGGVHETIAEKLIRRVYHNENRLVEPKLVGCIGKVSLLAPREAREDFYETLDSEEVIAFRPYNHRSYGAKFGYETCPSAETESWLVSFNGRPTSFYQFQTTNVERVAFMLKTVKPGLVFFMRNERGWTLECSVIEDQQLRKIVVVYRNADNDYVKLSAPITKLMGDWISVLVALNTNDKSLLLNVEDRDIWKETGDKVKKLLPNDGNVLLEGAVDVFLGGAGVYSESLDFGQSLDGCIGRLLINNKAEVFRQVPGTQYRLGHCSVQSSRQKHTQCQLDQKASLPDITQLPENSYCYTFGKQSASVRFLGKPKFSDRFSVSVKLRTVHRSGLIFYAHGNSSRKDGNGKPVVPDYMMAFLHDGRIVFRFDAGSGPLELSTNASMAKYNDGRLHKLTFFRDGSRYGFVGDLDPPIAQEFPASYQNRKIDGIDWLFLGGFSQEFVSMFDRAVIEQRGYERMEIDGRQTLIGTLSDFTLDGKLFEQPQPIDTSSCFDSLEHGVFFAELIERPSTASLSRRVQLDPYQFTLTLMIRPRTTRALIAYIHDLSDPSNSLAVFLSGGRLYAMPGSGSPRQAVNVPITHPCAGDWIRVVVGSRPDSIKIAADHQRQTLRLYRKRRGRDAIAQREMRLYVGGLPDRLRESRFTPVTDSFVGCIDAVYLGPPSSASLLPLSTFDRNGENGTISLVDYCPLY